MANDHGEPRLHCYISFQSKKLALTFRFYFRNLTIAWKFDTTDESLISTQQHHESNQLNFHRDQFSGRGLF